MHSSFTSKLTYTKALYCFSSAWLFAQGANCNGFRNEWSRGRQPLYYIIHNSPDGVGNERSRQATALVTRRLLRNAEPDCKGARISRVRRLIRRRPKLNASEVVAWLSEVALSMERDSLALDTCF